ncbi:MAG: ATP-binding cassette domain-containing protein [Nitrospiraceae bacterium]|nr:ATP-binding cassette domain-containing protein [Nitrospiraceae bacterium]
MTLPDVHAITEPGDIALAADGITKKFVSGSREVLALRGVSMKVRRGLVTGLIGPDGAGKTTLMRMAAGLLTPDEGKISVLGIDATRNSLEVQSSIGYMPQRFGLYEDLSVQENLDLYADLKGVSLNDRPGRYRELMTMTGLGPFTSRLAGRLSGGMKQKLGLACTLVNPPRLLILDEPTVGVDPVSRRELWSIVYRLVKDEGMSVLLSTAYLDEAERCDDVIVLHDGKILGSGPPNSFSGPMKGRTYRVSVPSLKNRTLQERLAGRPGVVDALVQGEAVRLVMKDAGLQEAAKLMNGMEGALIEPVAPRFEDSFISLLREDRPAAVQSEAATGKIASAAVSKNGETIIEVKDLQRRFGDFYAVKGVTFGVRRGEVFGLLGANGAGKSTTFRMLCGLLPPSGGKLSVAGVDLRRAAASARARIGYMSQKFSLYGNLSVRQNLDFFSSAYGLSGIRRTEMIEWALRQFGLAPVAGSTSADLPLGFKQRLAMACALMHAPDIIFLDEPTSGVDPLARREFWRRIDSLVEHGVTVLVTTHFMEEAEYCDRMAIMAAGEILAIGSPSEIKSLARTTELPEPTLEDAFIALITGKTEGAAA